MRLGRVAGVSDPGRKRRLNEDSFVCQPPLFAVADGMGGARAGEVASDLAASALRDGPSTAERTAEDQVSELIQEANRRVYERATGDNELAGMGTTMTVALVEDGVVTIGHVGDSRAYLVRRGELRQVTNDHSLVAELVRDGKLSAEEAETHPQRSVITRALGTDPDVDVDTFPVEVEEGDLFLLATDGLTSMVGDDSIRSIVEENRDDIDAAARALIQAANSGGGDDNITVVFFEITGAHPESATATMPTLGEERPSEDDDTLTELDAVPAVAGTARPVGAAGRARARGTGRSYRRRALLGATAFAVLAGLAVATLFGLSRSHFVGAGDDGHVVVYQGVPYDLVGPIRLYRAVYASPVVAAQLTPSERRRLFDHDLRSHDSALEVVKTYERALIR